MGCVSVTFDCSSMLFVESVICYQSVIGGLALTTILITCFLLVNN